jgi:hypothetical protein
MWRIARAALSVLLILGLTTACSPTRRGITAVRLDANGQLILILGLCKDFGTLKTVILYKATDDQGDVGDDVVTLKYSGKKPGSYVEVALAKPPAGWSSTEPNPKLSSQQRYVIRAWNSGSDSTAAVQTFAFAPADVPAHDTSKPIYYRQKINNDFKARQLSQAGFKDETARYCTK